MEEKIKKIGAPILGGLIAAAGIGVGFGLDNPDTIEVQVEKIVNQTVEVEKIVEVEVPVEVIVEKDNGNLDLVLEHLYDNDGNVEYLTEDLDDDEVQFIVDRIIFVDDVKKLAVDYVKKEGVDELDKEMVGDVELDEDDVEKFRVYDDDDEVVVDDVDFDDGEADVIVEAKFEQDDIDYKAVFKVEFEEGEVDDIEILEIYERE